MHNEILFTVLVAVGFLSVAAAATIGLKKLNFPYTIGLVVIGLVGGFIVWSFDSLSLIRGLELSPGIILYIILPCLIFDAAINIDVRLLVKNLVPIVLLAAIGVIISAFAIGFGLSWLTVLPIGGALLFGALISATDPVAVIALFKDIGAPRRLVTLIDGESVFNDATAIVLFTIIFAALTGGGAISAGTIAGGAGEFVLVLVGGLLAGGVVGLAGSFALQLDKTSLVFQKTVSLIAAYASFILADQVFHFSGVMASLGAGLVIRYRAEVSMKLQNIDNIEHAWGFFSFVANSFVFILLGLTEIHLIVYKGNVLDSLGIILISIPVVLVARVLCIGAIVPPYNWVRKKLGREPIPLNYQAILWWGGLRGAVPVALVLAIPLDFPNRDTILHVTMANILFTLLIQGTTIKWLMDRLGVRPDTSEFDDRKVEDTRFAFPAPALAELVLTRTRISFETEGFLVREKEDEGSLSYVMRKGRQLIALAQSGPDLVFTSEAREKAYINTVMSEALVELKQSVAAIKDVVKPEHISRLVGDSEAARDLSPSSINVLKLIQTDRIVVPLKSSAKEDCFGELLDCVIGSGVKVDRAHALADILEREASMCTGLGHQVATPHAKTDAVDGLYVAIGIHPDGIDYGALDGLPVRIVILILAPKADAAPHLQFLAGISKVLMPDAVREALCKAEYPEEVYDILREAAGPRKIELI